MSMDKDHDSICSSCKNWRQTMCASNSPMLFPTSFLLAAVNNEQLVDCAGFVPTDNNERQIISYSEYARDPSDYEILKSHKLTSQLLLVLFFSNIISFWLLLTNYVNVTKKGSSFNLESIENDIFVVHIIVIFGSLFVTFLISLVLNSRGILLWTRRVFIMELVILFSLAMEMFWGGVAMSLSMLIWFLIASSVGGHNYSSRYAIVRRKLKQLGETDQ